jgi:hypothetical protein
VVKKTSNKNIFLPHKTLLGTIRAHSKKNI